MGKENQNYLRELKKYYKENNYFNITDEINLLNKHYPTWKVYLCMTDRGAGKSSSTYEFIENNYFKKDNERIFGFIRTSDEEAKSTIISLVENKLIKVKKGEKTIIKPEYVVSKSEGTIRKGDDNRVIGICWGLSTYAKRKSVLKQLKGENGELGTNIADYIFYDEFNQMDILSNLRMKNPFFNLLNMYKTLARENDNCKLIILGNKDTINNFILNTLPIDADDVMLQMQNKKSIFHYFDGEKVVNIFGKNVFTLKSNDKNNWINKWAESDRTTNNYFNLSCFALEQASCIKNFEHCLKEILEIYRIYILNGKYLVFHKSLYREKEIYALSDTYHVENLGIDLSVLNIISLTKTGDTENRSVILDDIDLDDKREWLFALYKNKNLYFSSFDIWQDFIAFVVANVKIK